MSPRLTSISSASVTVTAIGANASSSSPSYVTIDFTLAALARRQHHHLVALAQDAGGDRAGEAAEVEVGADDVLHRETQVGQVAVAGDVHRLQVVQQRRAAIPGHRVALATRRCRPSSADIGMKVMSRRSSLATKPV